MSHWNLKGRKPQNTKLWKWRWKWKICVENIFNDFWFCKQMLCWDIYAKWIAMRNFDFPLFIPRWPAEFHTQLLLLSIQEKLLHEKPIKSFLYLFTRKQPENLMSSQHKFQPEKKMKNLSSSKNILHIKFNYIKIEQKNAYRTNQNIIRSTHDQRKRKTKRVYQFHETQKIKWRNKQRISRKYQTHKQTKKHSQNEEMI